MASQDTTNQSYLSKFSPWSQSTPTSAVKPKESDRESSGLQEQKGADHVVNNRHRLSLRQYPRDCPPLRPQWFHAVDVPKRRPHPGGKVKEEKPPAPPKKYAAFSKRDSKAIEAAFQKLVEEEDRMRAAQPTKEGRGQQHKPKVPKVPVNEDYLFDVDIEKRELSPAYWLGPVYDVRRGTWFYQDGSVQRPCDENLAAQLEEGYLKTKAWRLTSPQAAQTKPRSASQPRARPVSWAPGQTSNASQTSQSISAKQSSSDLRSEATNEPSGITPPKPDEPDQPQNTYRLFGTHMNSVVTYQDANTAWLLTDSTLSRMSVTVYERFAGGGHFAGMKMTRGYDQPKEKSESKDSKSEDVKNPSQNPQQQENEAESQHAKTSTESRRQLLHRQMSSLLDNSTAEGRASQEEEIRRRDEREIEDDYDDQGDQGREISHLILITHGIGQRLGLRLESVNFVHDVNTLRKTLKAVYADSPDLRALNDEHGDEEAEALNSRIQVLPICWRHLLDFPKQSLRHNRKEHDLADTDIDDNDYPSLDDITVDGVPHVRNLICDMGLDILIYDSPSYKEHIASLVLQECNRIYRLFVERNPGFNGKVSLIGHSLGSVIMFDILCRQKNGATEAKPKHGKNLQLDFEVEDFYALGSPIGLYQMLGGRTIASRQTNEPRNTSMDDPMLGAASNKISRDLPEGPNFGENPVSKPKCAQIYNIFHPTDPIAYRIEPLISPAMAALKPQPLPYTKRGIFGAPVGQGLTGIGARVSQSVSSMWSSVASSLLTRGLGYGEEPRSIPGSGGPLAKSSGPLSMSRAATNSSSASTAGNSSGVVLAQTAGATTTKESQAVQSAEDRLDKAASEVLAANQAGGHPPTLIDNEIETLSGDFEKRRMSLQSDAQTRDLGAGTINGTPEWADAEERGKKLRREEAKVRRLNSNGRVDYAIQEGAFDINLIAAIASHISYFSDEDVSHFVLSQLLSRHHTSRRRTASNAKSK